MKEKLNTNTFIVSQQMAEILNKFNREVAVYAGDELTPDDPIPGVNENCDLYRKASGAYVWAPPTE